MKTALLAFEPRYRAADGTSRRPVPRPTPMLKPVAAETALFHAWRA